MFRLILVAGAPLIYMDRYPEIAWCAEKPDSDKDACQFLLFLLVLTEAIACAQPLPAAATPLKQVRCCFAFGVRGVPYDAPCAKLQLRPQLDAEAV